MEVIIRVAHNFAKEAATVRDVLRLSCYGQAKTVRWHVEKI